MSFGSVEEGRSIGAVFSFGIVFGVHVTPLQGVVERPCRGRRWNFAVENLFAGDLSPVKLFIDTISRYNNLPVQGNASIDSLTEGVRIYGSKGPGRSRKIGFQSSSNRTYRL